MRWAHIDLGAQDLNDIQRPKELKQIGSSKVLDEYYSVLVCVYKAQAHFFPYILPQPRRAILGGNQ
jgi:hypothetical protein